MAVNKHLFMVCFDIVDDKIRYRVVKILLKYGQRVQKSVFECMLNDADYLQMKNSLDKLIEITQDSIRYYQLCANCEKAISVTGLGSFTEREELIII
jgi:CRISPR-associated protein Cas2